MVLRRVAQLSGAEASSVRALATAAAAADGHPPLSEQVLLHLSDQGAVHLLAGTAGYANLTGSTAELVVAPDQRRRGTGRSLADALLAGGPGDLRVWAHGEHPGATHLALSLGMRRGRVLLAMRRSLVQPVPFVRLPDGVALRAFAVGRDEQAWTALNARAFASHPEQGSWTVDEVLAREREDWFDPAGLLLAERGGRLVGFHWTKVHGDVEPPVGEVYVLGVDPAEQGSGLGSALTLAGLQHLASQGLEEVLLYVDEDNARAVRVYERLGFRVASSDVQWVR